MIKKILPKKIIDRLNGNPSNFYRMSTSISDDQVYPDFCANASIASDLFLNFRKNPIYQKILEHVSKDIGKLYLDEIKRNLPNYLNYFEKFKENDLWGNPELFEYPEIGTISPSTLRYIKVYTDLRRLFGSLDDLKICEIGVGYGGQCRIINSGESPKEYALVDIKQALLLTQRYLDNYVLNSQVKYSTMNELEKKQYDLVISNYAFTELPRKIQDEYLKKVILNSDKGYITYNEISPAYFDSYDRNELRDLIPNSKIVDEKPLTHPKNCIIIWGYQDQTVNPI